MMEYMMVMTAIYLCAATTPWPFMFDTGMEVAEIWFKWGWSGWL